MYKTHTCILIEDGKSSIGSSSLYFLSNFLFQIRRDYERRKSCLQIQLEKTCTISLLTLSASPASPNNVFLWHCGNPQKDPEELFCSQTPALVHIQVAGSVLKASASALPYLWFVQLYHQHQRQRCRGYWHVKKRVKGIFFSKSEPIKLYHDFFKH